MPIERRLKSLTKTGLRQLGIEISIYRRDRTARPIDHRPRSSVSSTRAGKPRLVLLHHQAATGGTLISAMLASHPQVRLLSEIHPDYLANGGFSPSTPVDQYQRHFGPLPSDLAQAAFRDQITHLTRAAAADGCILIVRDHAHRDVMKHPDRPVDHVLRDALGRIAESSLLTVRHPLDSYLSAGRDWLSALPDLDAYAERYLGFLGAYPASSIYRYEDLVADPKALFRNLTSELRLSRLAFDPSKLRPDTLSGNSGRSGPAISLRRRRRVPRSLRKQLAGDKYRLLCTRLGYDPE